MDAVPMVYCAPCQRIRQSPTKTTLFSHFRPSLSLESTVVLLSNRSGIEVHFGSVRKASLRDHFEYPKWPRSHFDELNRSGIWVT